MKKKGVLLLAILLLLVLACNCPLMGLLGTQEDDQNSLDETAAVMELALTDEAYATDVVSEEIVEEEVVPEPTALPTEVPEPVLGIGSMYVREKDGMEMMYVPAGPFIMGSNAESYYDDEDPAHEVYLDAFWIDKYEVTNGQYQQCVEEGFCVILPSTEASRTREQYYGNPEFADYPVIYVEYYAAFDYCLWASDRRGLTLPTEAQWEKAARGTDERLYPWGNTSADCSLLNMAGCNEDTVAVGSYPGGASPYGVMDMAGNVWEWTRDHYGENYYSVSPMNNPEGPEEFSDMNVIRGGSWGEGDDNQRTVRRYAAYVGSTWYSLGFRCVITEESLAAWEQ
jgi:eukaryotic-like serine/threonine-protein kinase